MPLIPGPAKPDWLWKIVVGSELPTPAAIKFPAGKVVYHGTTKAFDVFRPDLFGDKLQALWNWVHAAEDPSYAARVALEPRRGATTALGIIPLRPKVGPLDEFLDLTPYGVDMGNFARQDAERLFQALPSDWFSRRQIAKELYKSVPDFPKLADMLEEAIIQKPSIVEKAGFKGIRYKDWSIVDPLQSEVLEKILQDLGVPADQAISGISWAFPMSTPLETPYGVPLTKTW